MKRNYTREDIMNLVREEDVEIYPAAVYRYVWESEKCGDYIQPAGKGIGQ